MSGPSLHPATQNTNHLVTRWHVSRCASIFAAACLWPHRAFSRINLLWFKKCGQVSPEPSSGTFHRNTRAPLTMPFNVSPCQALPLLIRMSGTLCVWLRSSMEGWLKLGWGWGGGGGLWGWGVAFLAIPWKKGCNHGSKPRGGLNYAWLHKAQSYQRAMSQQTQPHWASDPRKSPLEKKKKNKKHRKSKKQTGTQRHNFQ